MPPQAQDWFASNAPAPPPEGAADWFAKNAPPPVLQRPMVDMQQGPPGVVDAMKQSASDIGKQIYHASAPYIAKQIWAHIQGKPSDIKSIPQNAVMAFLAAGGLPEGEAGELAPEAPKLTVGSKQLNVAPAERAIVASEPKALPAPVEAAQPLPSTSNIPRTLSGDSALRQVLTGQDNANLLKIARSRGINVTKEAQLKAGVADNLLINKIIDDFSPEEFDNMRSTFMESQRNRAQFGDIGPEAWKTMSLKTYFPDVKISAAQLKRTAAAVGNTGKQALSDTLATTIAPSDEGDLTSVLKQSLKLAKLRKR